MPLRLLSLVGGLIEELERHSPMRLRGVGAYRLRDERRLDNLLTRRARGSRAFRVRFHTERALNRHCHTHSDELAILPRDGAIGAGNDAIEIHPRLVVGGRECAHVLQALDVGRVVIVVAHRVSLRHRGYNRAVTRTLRCLSLLAVMLAALSISIDAQWVRYPTA